MLTLERQRSILELRHTRRHEVCLYSNGEGNLEFYALNYVSFPLGRLVKRYLYKLESMDCIDV
jgi:hypothetical protein